MSKEEQTLNAEEENNQSVTETETKTGTESEAEAAKGSFNRKVQVFDILLDLKLLLMEHYRALVYIGTNAVSIHFHNGQTYKLSVEEVQRERNA